MRNMVLTLVLVLPLGGGAALAQGTAEEIGGAVGGAIDDTASGIAEGLGSALDAAEDELDVEALRSRFASRQLESQVRGSRLIGAEVQSVEGERIGEIVDLVFDRVTGGMSALVVAPEGAEDRQVALDWAEVQLGTDGITASLSPAEVEAAPDYEFVPE